MSVTRWKFRCRWILPVLVLALGTVAATWAQNSSLYHSDVPVSGARPLTASGNSLVFLQQPLSPKVVTKQDIITVVVNEKSQLTSEAEVERRKKSSIKAVLEDWLHLGGLTLKPDLQPGGDPTITGDFNSQYRAEADIETRNGLTFRIAAKIVDIRPNGNLVLEAHRQIRVNNEVWEFSLSGIIRQDDILPNNEVLSEDVAELHIDKRERGSVRDGYKRGWITRLYDFLMPI